MTNVKYPNTRLRSLQKCDTHGQMCKGKEEIDILKNIGNMGDIKGQHTEITMSPLIYSNDVVF